LITSGAFFRVGDGLRLAAAGFAGLGLQRHELRREFVEPRRLDVQPLVGAHGQQAVLALEGGELGLRRFQGGAQLGGALVEEGGVAARRLQAQRQAGVHIRLHIGVGDLRRALAVVGGVADRDHARLLGRPHVELLLHARGLPLLEVAHATGLAAPELVGGVVRVAAHAERGHHGAGHALALDQVHLGRHVGRRLARLLLLCRHRQRVGRLDVHQHHRRGGVLLGQQGTDQRGHPHHGGQHQHSGEPARLQRQQKTGE